MAEVHYQGEISDLQADHLTSESRPLSDPSDSSDIQSYSLTKLLGNASGRSFYIVPKMRGL